MVKVVGRNESAVRRATCKSCASILEFTKAETRRVGHTDYLGDTDYYDILDCPVCKEEVYVDLVRQF